MINDHDIYFTWKSFSTTIPLMFCRTSSSDWHKCSASGLINRCPFNLSYHGNLLLPVQALKKVLIEAQECVVLFSVLAGCYTDPAPYWSLIPAELCYSHIFLNSTEKFCQIHQCSTARNNYFLTQTFKQAFQVRILCLWGSKSIPHSLTCSQRPSGCPPQIYPAVCTALVLLSWSALLPLQEKGNSLSEWAAVKWQAALTDRWHTEWHQCVWSKEPAVRTVIQLSVPRTSTGHGPHFKTFTGCLRD